MNRKIVCLAGVFCIFGLVLAADQEKSANFELTIIHTNDNHSNHEPQPAGDGGDARQATVIRQIQREVKNHLTIDAGDRFTGSLFHTQYKGLDNVPFLNKLGFQALAIGNHEFDEGDEGLANLAGKINCPIVCANIDVSKSKQLAGKIKPYTIITVGQQKIAIIGLATIDTKTGSRPSAEVTFDNNYVGIVQSHVDNLTKQGINKIVLLSHIGLSEDLRIAGQLQNVDVIVGGHSHTVLSKMYREAKNTYPMKVLDKAGQPIYIVQAGGGDNRFVGRLDLEFDDTGVVKKAGGDLIHLSKYIPADPEIEAEVKRLAEPIDKLKKQKLLDKAGQPVRLVSEMPNTKVRDEETVLGDLFADAMRIRAKAQIAILGGGGLRAGLSEGEITVGDIYRVLPFTNKLTAFKLQGTDLLATLEHGTSRYGESGSGRFLQVSGLRYEIDVARPKGARLLKAEVQTEAGWVKVDPQAFYRVASDNYIRFGGDDFFVLRDKAVEPDEDLPPIQDVIMNYLGQISPVQMKLEDRIKIRK